MEIKKNAINKFLNQKEIAVAGASRNKQKFGYLAFDLLRNNNYIVYPVNPNMNVLDNVTCFPDITSLPDSVTAVFIITPVIHTANIVHKAILKGIKHIWIQRSAETIEAIEIAMKNKVNLIMFKCIFMYIDQRKVSHNAYCKINNKTGILPE